MLRLSLRQLEVWDEKEEVFRRIGKDVDVELEHSLYTISIFEQKHRKAFANGKGLSAEELMDYVKTCMCLTPDVPDQAWLSLTQKDVQKITEYIEDPACATTIKRTDVTGGRRGSTVTAELIYFYMAQFNIPLEFEHWHLNRLMTLIEVAAIKSAPPKKMNKRDAARQQAALNAKRLAMYGSRG